MLEITFIVKWAHTIQNSVCLSDMENNRLGGVIVHVWWAHVVISAWSVLLFSE